jgi:hypothetical protein
MVTRNHSQLTRCDNPVPVVPIYVAIGVGEVSKACVVCPRRVEPRSETSVPGSDRRFVPDLTDRDPMFDQAAARGLEVADDEIDVAK